jgi:flavodoxin
MKTTSKILLRVVLIITILACLAGIAFAQIENKAVIPEKPDMVIKEKMTALIMYHSKTGHTLEAANAIAEGIRSAGGSATIVPAKNFIPTVINQYDVFIVGSPCWGGSIADGVSTPVSNAIKSITVEVKDKLCAGFSVNAGYGGQSTVRSIGKRLQEKGCGKYVEGPVAKAGAPLSLWKGPAVKPEDLARYKAFGEDLVRQFTEQKK